MTSETQRDRKPLGSLTRDLSERERRFVAEYLVDLNGKAAAIRAGYGRAGAAVQAARLLTRDNVRAAIERRQQARVDRVEIGADEVMRGLHAEATRMGEGSSHSARVAAWGLIGKHVGMFVERSQQLGADGRPVDPTRPVLNIVIESGTERAGAASATIEGEAKDE